MMKSNDPTHRGLFATVQVVRVASQCPATVQLDVELVVIPSSPVNVDAQRIICESYKEAGHIDLAAILKGYDGLSYPWSR